MDGRTTEAISAICKPRFLPFFYIAPCLTSSFHGKLQANVVNG